MRNHRLALTVIPEIYAICRLDCRAPVPDWADARPFSSVTRNADELSIVCPESVIPDGVKQDKGWRALKLEGPFAFNLTGILYSVLSPLYEAQIPVFAISTYDTDYILIKSERFEPALEALAASGHRVQRLMF